MHQYVRRHGKGTVHTALHVHQIEGVKSNGRMNASAGCKTRQPGSPPVFAANLCPSWYCLIPPPGVALITA